MASARRGYDKIHNHQHRVVTPAVRSALTPEPCMPDENLFVGAKHYKDQTDSSQFRPNSEYQAQRPGAFGSTQKK